MMKIQITNNEYERLLEEHWKWFDDYINKREKRLANKNPEEKLIINDILKELALEKYDDLELIIKATREDCLEYINKLGIKETQISNKIYDFFCYENWLNKDHVGWNAYEYIQKLGIKVCPYCNRNNIDYSEMGKKITRSPLDHFFPKKKYPYLSCTLSNLIPCCHTCNSAKSNESTYDTKIIYPYQEEFGEDGKFMLMDSGKEFDKKAQDIKKEITKNFSVKIESKGFLKENIDNSASIFNLCTLYSQERDLISGLLEKIDMCTEFFDRTYLLNKDKKICFKLLFNLPKDNNQILKYQKITMDIIEHCRPDLKKYFSTL